MKAGVYAQVRPDSRVISRYGDVKTAIARLFLPFGSTIIPAMQIENLAVEYQAKTNDELLRLAMDSDQLSSEAQTYLTSELSRRGISAEQISSFREEEQCYTEASLAPWRPKVAGLIAFFFGPIAGALIVAISLRRMGCQQTAKKVMLLVLGATAVESVILFFIPDVQARRLGRLGARLAFGLIFPVFMENEFNGWQATHPSATPSNGWKAIGWGLVGIVLFLVITFFVVFGLSALLPARQ